MPTQVPLPRNIRSSAINKIKTAIKKTEANAITNENGCANFNSLKPKRRPSNKPTKNIKKQLKTTHHSIQTLYLEPNLDNTQLTALKQQLIHLHEQKIDHKFTYLKSLKELLSEKQFNLYIKKHCEKKKCY